MKLYAFGTHSDWIYGGGSWGRPGLQRIADFCLEAGISRLYWRSHNGGQAKYPSCVATNADGATYRDPEFKGLGALPKSYFAYMEEVDYSQWDQLADMAEVGASKGVEVAHWYTFLEDDHGGHLASDFLRAHPELRVCTRDGEPVPGCLDFWFPAVREYKLSIIRELLSKPASRLLLDLLRRNGRPSADVGGHHRYGFHPEKVAAFHAETGLDALALQPGTPEWARWIDFNAAALTGFLREAGALARAAGRPLDLLVWPVDQREWLALDLPTLAREGVVSEVVVGSHTYSYSPDEVDRQLAALRPQLEASGVPVIPSLPAYHEVPPEGFEGFAQRALEQGCPAMALCESDALLRTPISDRMRAVALGKPYHARAVVAQRVPGVPDWGQIPLHSGFLRTFATDEGKADQETAFQFAHDGQTLYLRVICHERNPGGLLPVPCYDQENYNVQQLGSRTFWDPYESVHLFLDHRHQHEDYARFGVDAANDSFAGQRVADGWPHPWAHTARIGTDRWEATMALPLASFGIGEPSGKVLGFQLVRVQNQPREVTAWFNTRGRRITPADFGHLSLE